MVYMSGGASSSVRTAMTSASSLHNRSGSSSFVTLETVLGHLAGGRSQVVFDARPRKYKFGTRNYGEVAHEWRNAADGDRWDVFAPGLPRALPTGRPFRVRAVLGVLWLPNGNHKIAVRLAADQGLYNETRAREETARFVNEYTRRMRLVDGSRWLHAVDD